MTGPGNRVGIRNKLPAHREHRGLEHDYSENGFTTMLQELGKVTIGRFLLSKGQVRAGEDKVDNSILDVRKNLSNMNRHRGIAVDIGSIMLTYQSPDEFQQRVLTRVQNHKEDRRLTPRGLKQHVYEIKKNVAATFRSQSVEASRMQDAQMRLEDQQERLRLMTELEEHPAYTNMSPDEYMEEFEAMYVDVRETAPRGFKLTQKIHFVDDQVGVKIRQRDEPSAALLQNDIDRVNAAYDAHGLLSQEHPEVKLEDVSLFVPLFHLTINPNQAKDELYLPYITRTAVPFQELGIHKVQ